MSNDIAGEASAGARAQADGAAPSRSRRFDPGALRALWPFARRYRGRMAAALAALTVAAGATLALPVAVRLLVDRGFAAGRSDVGVYFVGLGLVALALAVASACRYYLVMTLGERIVADVRAAVFRHLTTLDASFYDSVRSGELVSRLTADTTQIKAAFGASASVALRNLFMFVGAVTMMVITSPRLSLVVLGVIPLVVLPLIFSGRGVSRRSRAAQDRLADASAYAVEALGAARTMQAFGAEQATAGHFEAASEQAFVAARDATFARALLTGFAIFLVSASVVAVLWLGARGVLAGGMTMGRLSQFLLFAVLAASALGELSQVWAEIVQASGAAGRLGELLATRPRIVAPARPLPMPEPARGALAFERVSFAYPGRRETKALHDLSFTAAPGERIAIVGPSGAGKSTIIQLALRFYDPDSGAVRVDGVDARAVAPADWRRRFALVAQDPVIFGASVADNIRYGRPDASDAEVRRAAAFAAADGFISALPQGYDTLVGERGVTLSGGQRQRLAIARAVLKDAPILLLDEATSALDAESERLVQEAFDRLMTSRTTLVVAHRLATVLSADRILVMDGGVLVEQGTHASLVAAGGLYARLAKLQFGQADGDGTVDAPAAAVSVR
ncbi:ABC transporter transmembrane domain-containing protein [Camelimonas abortus]|uniref:ABC transporter transmembrane domain-containing protein n=1 Tax=Camelimonas abortus TaxID=1017184 RepID=A0ABV7LE21_9HYPH